MAIQSLRARHLLVAFAVVTTAASEMQAQSEPADCQSARAAARAHAADQSALWTLSRCPSAGPSELVSLWGRQDLGPRTSAILVEASGSLRDARILEAVSKLASDANRPAASRLAALQVLLRYYDPRYAPSTDDLRRMEIGSPIAVRIGGGSPINGSSPLPADVRSRVAVTLAALATTDQDAEIQHAARFLRQALAIEDPANTPLPPNAVSLVAGCGTRVSLRSTADVSLPVVVSVLGSNFEHTYSIRAGSSAQPRAILLSLPVGTVTASYGGTEVARLTARNAACPPGVPR